MSSMSLRAMTSQRTKQSFIPLGQVWYEFAVLGGIKNFVVLWDLLTWIRGSAVEGASLPTALTRIHVIHYFKNSKQHFKSHGSKPNKG